MIVIATQDVLASANCNYLGHHFMFHCNSRFRNIKLHMVKTWVPLNVNNVCELNTYFHSVFLTIKEMYFIRKVCQQQVPCCHGNCKNNLMKDIHDWLIVLLETAETEWDLDLYLECGIWNSHPSHKLTHMNVNASIMKWLFRDCNPQNVSIEASSNCFIKMSRSAVVSHMYLTGHHYSACAKSEPSSSIFINKTNPPIPICVVSLTPWPQIHP